jgi:hypothetical protein
MIKIFLTFSFIVIALSSFGQSKFKTPFTTNIYYDTLANDSTIMTLETLDAKGRLVNSNLRLYNGTVWTDTQYKKTGIRVVFSQYYSDSVGMRIIITYGKKGLPISRRTEWVDKDNTMQMREQFFTKKGAIIPKKHKRYMIPI